MKTKQLIYSTWRKMKTQVSFFQILGSMHLEKENLQSVAVGGKKENDN